jgi:DNA-binding SARP family transcriptional activator
MSVLRISLFGGFQITRSSWQCPLKVPRIGQALLAYLLLQRQRSHSRELLVSLFWGDYCQERARCCLNTTLWRLRRDLEPAGIDRGTYLTTNGAGEVGFNPKSDYWLDVEAFEDQTSQVLTKPIQAMTTADVQILDEALQLYTGELLEGFYDDWALRERERLRRLYLNSLAQLLHYHKQHGAYEEGLACGQQILDQDPLREEIHREMMCLYCESGQRPLAVQQYQCCCQVLATELDISPMAETQALYAHIVQLAEPNPAQSTAIGESICYQQVLHQLLLARQEFDQARQQLQRAIEFAERFAKHPK